MPLPLIGNQLPLGGTSTFLRGKRLAGPTPRLARNMLYSAASVGWPMALAVITTPLIIRYLGNEQYGAYLLVVSMSGLVSLVDPGLAAASIRYIAAHAAVGDEESLLATIATNLVVNAALGAVSACALWAASEAVVFYVLQLPPSLYDEGVWALRFTGIGIGLSLVTAVYASVAAGLQRYDAARSLTLVLGTLTAAAQLGAAWAGYGLVGLGAVSLIISTVSCLLHVRLAFQLCPALELTPRFRYALLRSQFSFGMYSAICRFATLALFQLDLLILRSLTGVAVIPVYAVPRDFLRKVNRIFVATTDPLLPRLSAIHANGDHQYLRAEYFRLSRLLAALTVVVVVPFTGLVEPAIRGWIGDDFARAAAPAAQWMVIGFALANFTSTAYFLAAAAAKPELNAFLLVFQSITTLGALAVFVPKAGTEGAGMAVCVGTGMTAILTLFVIEVRLFGPSCLTAQLRAYVPPLLVGAVIAATGIALVPTSASIFSTASAYGILTLASALLCVLTRAITPEEIAESLRNIALTLRTPRGETAALPSAR